MKKLFLSLLLLPTFSCLPELPKPEVTVVRETILKRDKEAAQKLADTLLSASLLRDAKKIVVRSKKPVKEYLQGVFHHMDFHKHQLVNLKECIAEISVIVHGVAVVMCDFCVEHADAPETQKFMEYLTEVYMPKSDPYHDANDMEKLQEAALALSTRLENDPRQEQIDQAIDQLNDWQEKWTPFIVSLAGYMQARGQTCSTQLTNHTRALTVSVLFANFWFAVKCFLQRNSLLKMVPNFDGDKERQAVYGAALVKHLYANAIARKAQVKNTLQNNIVDAIDQSVAMINQVIDESMTRSK